MSTSRQTVAANTPNGAVALPKRNLINQNEPPRPVWSLESGPQTPGGSSEVPLGASLSRTTPFTNGELTSELILLDLCTASKCDVHNRERTVCCRDLKGDDERALVNPDIVRDIIM